MPCLSRADYSEFVLPWTRMLFGALPADFPLIHFGTGTGMLLEFIVLLSAEGWML
jgi:uroporphyrinogen-III decarboxylase